jgi:hypothetical protein
VASGRLESVAENKNRLLGMALAWVYIVWQMVIIPAGRYISPAILTYILRSSASISFDLASLYPIVPPGYILGSRGYHVTNISKKWRSKSTFKVFMHNNRVSGEFFNPLVPAATPYTQYGTYQEIR